MNVKTLQGELDYPSMRDDWPVLIWADAQWMTPKSVISDEDRVMIVLEPFDPWPNDPTGKRR